MSRRTSIVKAIAEKFKELNGETPYSVNIYNNSFDKLKFWDEINDFPSIYTVPGSETREYHPAGFKWGFLGVAIKVYCKGESSDIQLENLLEDIETLLDSTKGIVVYDESNNHTTEISITSIITDEGLLAPYAVGEINLLVRYEVN